MRESLLEAVRSKVFKIYKNWRFHLDYMNGELKFPLSFNLPKIKDIDLDKLRNEVSELREYAGKHGANIVWQEFNKRSFGKMRLPVEIVFEERGQYLNFIGESSGFGVFEQGMREAALCSAAVYDYLLTQPQLVLKHAVDWEKILATVDYFLRNPRSGFYIRQLPIAGVDTKFIASNRGVILQIVRGASSLLDGYSESQGKGRHFFERCLGLRSPSQLIRFRILDSGFEMSGFSDLSVPLEDFLKLDWRGSTVVFTENLINGLICPSLSGALVVFGLGYGVESLREVPWFFKKRLIYWGDLDSHGFKMLIDMRKAYPHLESLLMDMECLRGSEEFLGSEDEARVLGEEDLALLKPFEREAYNYLCELGGYLRLEQERVPIGVVKAAFAAL